MYVLSSGNTIATLDRIGRSKRMPLNQVTVEYSQNRTAILDGPSYEFLPFVWEIEAYCTVEATRALQALESEQLRLLRAGAEPEFILADYRKEVVEALPRRRRLVPGKTAINQPDGKVAYYAQFYCHLTTLEIAEQTARTRVLLTLAEGKILPP